MAASDQTILDNARDALNNLLLMDGVEEYSSQEKRFRAQRIADLKDLIFELEARVTLSGGAGRLVKPVEDVA